MRTKGAVDRKWSEYCKSTNKFLTEEQIETARRHFNKNLRNTGCLIPWDKVKTSINELNSEIAEGFEVIKI